MNARQQFDDLFTAVSEETRGSELGFGFFLTQSGITEEREFIAALLALVNGEQGAPAAGADLRDLLNDAIQKYCQEQADARQFGRGRFPPGPRSVRPFKDAREVAAVAFGVPQEGTK